MSDIGGVWRTVGGRRIFIKDGEDLQTAMKNSGKFKTEKQKRVEKLKKENEELYKKYNKFDKINEDEEVKKAYEKWKQNADEANKLQSQYRDYEARKWEYDKEQPEAVKFEKMLERHNVRTFADDIELREMSKMSNKDLVEYEKSKGSFKTSDNAEFARVKELYYETGLAKYKDKMDEILKKHNIR